MNRRLCVWFAALGMGVGGSWACGQAGPATNPAALTPISVATKGSATIGPAERTEITAYISANVNFIAGPDVTIQTPAVRFIASQAPGLANGFTVQYLDAYANILDQQVVAALKTNPPLRVRLNLAVASAVVAQQTAVNEQSTSAELLLQDQSEAVVLWGMKTAKNVLPQFLAVAAPNGKNTLLPLMVSAALKYPGPVLDEAYEGLTLEPLNLTLNPKAVPAHAAEVRAVIPVVQDLFAKRNATWSAGVPKAPAAESQPILFLVQTVWSLETPAQRKQTLQLMHDLLANASGAFGAAQDKTVIADLIAKNLGGGFLVIASAIQDQQITDAATAIKRINVGTPAAQVSAACSAVLQAVEANPMMAPAPGAAPVTQAPTTKATSAASPAGTVAGIK